MRRAFANLAKDSKLQAAYYVGDRKFEVGARKIQPPGPSQVRIEVAYCGVYGADLHIYMGHMYRRIDVPQVIGHEMSGTIAEVGEGVKGWVIGDSAVVRPFDACGECRPVMRAMAMYARI